MAGPCGVIRLDGGMPGLCTEKYFSFIKFHGKKKKEFFWVLVFYFTSHFTASSLGCVDIRLPALKFTMSNRDCRYLLCAPTYRSWFMYPDVNVEAWERSDGIMFSDSWFSFNRCTED